MSATVNQAVEDCLAKGILNSTCLMMNMPGTADALKRLAKYEKLSVGVHLNIIQGRTVDIHPAFNSLLYNQDGIFRHGFFGIMLRSLNAEYMQEVEHEFRSQIENMMKVKKPDRIDSHVHVHAIPAIFDLVCRLAREYDIPCVRTQHEFAYDIPGFAHFFSPKYYINTVKVLLLNFFTFFNKYTLKKYGLKSNDCVIGVGYTGMMTEKAIAFGVRAARKNKKANILEIICHPDINSIRKSNYTEYKALLSSKLKRNLSSAEFTTYEEISENV